MASVANLVYSILVPNPILLRRDSFESSLRNYAFIQQTFHRNHEKLLSFVYAMGVSYLSRSMVASYFETSNFIAF